jgi:hypothetical protein
VIATLSHCDFKKTVAKQHVTAIAKKQLQKQVKCDCKNQFKKLNAAEKENTHKNIAEFQFTNSNKKNVKLPHH